MKTDGQPTREKIFNITNLQRCQSKCQDIISHPLEWLAKRKKKQKIISVGGAVAITEDTSHPPAM